MNTNHVKEREAVICQAVRHFKPINVTLSEWTGRQLGVLGFEVEGASVEAGGNFHIFESGPRQILVERNREQALGHYFSASDGGATIDCDGDWIPVALIDIDTGKVERLDQVMFAVRSGRSWQLDEAVSI